MKSEERKVQWKKALAGILICAVAAFYGSQAVLYTYQALASPDRLSEYFSDLYVYMGWIRDGTPIYSMAGDTMGTAYKLGGEIAVGVLLALFALLSLYAAYRALKLCGECRDGILLIFAALISQAAFTAHIPGRFYYKGLGLTVNNFHSPTYIQMEPFAIFATACLFAILPRLRQKQDTKTLLVFALCCTLATYAKPSFLFCMAPALLLVLLVDFGLTKCKNIKNEILVGICVLPGVAVALRQSVMLFDESSKIIFAPVLNWLMIGRAFAEGVFRAGIFALAVLLLYGVKYFRKHWFSFSYLVAAVGVGEYLCLMETGDRAEHGNLAWSAQIGLYFALLAGIAVLLGERKRWKTPRWLLCALLLLWQVISGVIYYVLLLRHGSFWI